MKQSNRKNKVFAFIHEAYHKTQSDKLHKIARLLSFLLFLLGWEISKYRNEIAAFLINPNNLLCVFIILMMLIIILIDFLISYIDRWIQYGDTWKEGSKLDKAETFEDDI